MNHMRTTIGTLLFFCALGSIAACGKISGLDDVPIFEDGPLSQGQDAGTDSAKLDSAPVTVPDSSPKPPACLVQGATGCASNGDCCTVEVAPGSAVACTPAKTCATCKLEGQTCGNSDLCCGGQACNLQTFKCPGACKVEGEACSQDGECCGGAQAECNGGKCRPCRPSKGTCKDTAECCGVGVKCGGTSKVCGACKAKGETGCTSNDDCCGNLVCATNTETPSATSCVEQCSGRWTFSNLAEPCKNAEAGFTNRPCCAPMKCTVDIPATEAVGCQ